MFKSRYLIAGLSVALGIAAASGCVRRERVIERERPVVEREVVRERERPTVEIREAPRTTERIEIERR
jgi:hypothetical protein